MLLITYEISKKLYPNKPLYMEIRTWNIRAVKCYQKQDLGLMDKFMSWQQELVSEHFIEW